MKKLIMDKIGYNYSVAYTKNGDFVGEVLDWTWKHGGTELIINKKVG